VRTGRAVLLSQAAEFKGAATFIYYILKNSFSAFKELISPPNKSNNTTKYIIICKKSTNLMSSVMIHHSHNLTE
jgi:hypothetical protein